MIRLRIDVADVQRMRFAYSPLTEIAESLYRLHDTARHPLLEPWLARARQSLHAPDVDLLRALVPAQGNIANFLGPGAADTRTTVDDQLRFVAQCDADRLRDDLARVWRTPVPDRLRHELDGDDLPERAAEALRTYWRSAVEPLWPRMLAVLEADVAHRTRRLVTGGLAALLEDLHDDVTMSADSIEILAAPPDSEHRLPGSGLLMVPSVFTWPDLVVDPGRTGNPSITYGARGIGVLWHDEVPAVPGDALASLLGRTRAAVLRAAQVPVATTDLAQAWNQSAGAVSAHLTALRDAGLLVSWRSGRRVLYQQTPLAASVVRACRGDDPRPAHQESTTPTH